jgi:hypothetical protein
MSSADEPAAEVLRLDARSTFAVILWFLVLGCDVLFLLDIWVFGVPLLALHVGLPLILRRRRRDWCAALTISAVVSACAWIVAFLVVLSQGNFI